MTTFTGARVHSDVTWVTRMLASPQQPAANRLWIPLVAGAKTPTRNAKVSNWLLGCYV